MTGGNNTVSVSRFSGSTKSTRISHLSNLSCYMEPLSSGLQQGFDGAFVYDVFKFVFDDVYDIQESDLLTDSTSRTYTVKEVQHYENNGDVENHSELIAVRKNDKPTA